MSSVIERIVEEAGRLQVQQIEKDLAEFVPANTSRSRVEVVYVVNAIGFHDYVGLKVDGRWKVKR